MHSSHALVALMAALSITSCISKGDTNIDSDDEERAMDDDAIADDDAAEADDDAPPGDDDEPSQSDDDAPPGDDDEPSQSDDDRSPVDDDSDDDATANDDDVADDDPMGDDDTAEPEPSAPADDDEPEASCDIDNGGCDMQTDCTDGPSGPECSDCPEGTSGTGLTGCEPVCEPNPCRNGGTCMEDGNDFICECGDEYSGDRCETAVFVELAAGGANTCGRRGDGTVECWGGPPLDDYMGNEGALPPEGTYTQIRVGRGHACGLLEDQSIVCWGENAVGEGSSPAGTYLAVGVHDTSCGLRVSGGVFCWGDAGAPTDWVPPPDTGAFKQLDGDIGAGCAIDGEDYLVCWGYPHNGLTDQPDGLFKQVSVSNNAAACAITVGDTLICWGSTTSPIVTDAPDAELAFVHVETGEYHACALAPDGFITCWGAEPSGQMFGQTSPPPYEFHHFACGALHCCGVHSDNELECWGSNFYGETTPP